MRKLEMQFNRLVHQEEIMFAEIHIEANRALCDGDNPLREEMVELAAIITGIVPTVHEIDELYRKAVEPYEIYMA